MSKKIKACEKDDIADNNQSITDKNLERMKVLLALGARADVVREDNDPTNLMMYILDNKMDFAEILVRNYCNPNTTRLGKNTFWITARRGEYDFALLLRVHGAGMNVLSLEGDTILHYAYHHKDKQMELFNFLLNAGASPNTKSKKPKSVQFETFLNKDDEIAEMI